MAGMRPIIFHPRMDFMLLAVDPIINQAANWSYMFAGKIKVPVVIRVAINRGGEQAAQHSQALQSIFSHIPGLKVVMPSTPYDAKGLLLSAVDDGNPVIYIEDRWLYDEIGTVPEKKYAVPIGSAKIVRKGTDLTVVSSSYMTTQCVRAAKQLGTRGINCEIIDLRSVKPWDKELVFKSLRKTGRLLIVEAAWSTGGVAAEISATASEQAFDKLKTPVVRLTLPDAPAPMSKPLEKAYYLGEKDVIAKIEDIFNFCN